MSLADALELLSKNKHVGDDTFNSIFSNPSTRYTAIKESIAAFRAAFSKARILNNPALVARYVRVIASMVEQKQHIQHVSVEEWAELVSILAAAYEALKTEQRELTFAKNTYDLFRALMLLLEARESVDSNCFEALLSMCEDFCGSGAQRETSCHQFIMACVRHLSQMRYEKAHDLGRRIIGIGKPRQTRLRREMFAFSCLVPQLKSDVLAIGPKIIESREVEFAPAPHLGLPYFRPSPEADLVNYFSAKALSYAAGEAEHQTESSRKRRRSELTEIELMAIAFGAEPESDVTDPAVWPRRSFWLFVVLTQRVNLLTSASLFEAWKLAVDCIRYDECASSACFCLSRLVARFVEPDYIDERIVSRITSLLTTMSESSYPSLSSGSLHLWNTLLQVRILDAHFQKNKNVRLHVWHQRSVNEFPSSLLSSYFCRHCQMSNIDNQGLEELEYFFTFHKMEKFLSNLEPSDMSDPRPAYTPTEFPGTVISGLIGARTLRDALWIIALNAHSKAPPPDINRFSNIDAISNSDIRAIEWFANLFSNCHWPHIYSKAAVALISRIKMDPIAMESEFGRGPDLAIASLEDTDFSIGTLVSGHADSVIVSNPVTALLGLQPIFQSYTLQRSQFVVRNVLKFLRNPLFTGLPELRQLLGYLKGFILRQSPFSRLRPSLAELLIPSEGLTELIQGSSTENALFSIPASISSDSFALTVLLSLPDATQKPAGFLLMVRGSSPAKIISYLLQKKALYPNDQQRVVSMLNMGSGKNIVECLATPILFGEYSAMFEPIAQYFAATSAVADVELSYTRLVTSPQSLDDDDAAELLEDMMRGCTYIGSIDEKIECMKMCCFFLRAHAPKIESSLLKVCIRGIGVLAHSISHKPRLKEIESLLATLFTDSDDVEKYSSMAADLAFAGFEDLAANLAETEGSSPSIMRLTTPHADYTDPAEFPSLVLDLLNEGEHATYEIWTLAFRGLMRAAAKHAQTFLDVFLERSDVKELARALQVWTYRLKANENANWMSFIGQLAAEVGDLTPHSTAVPGKEPQSLRAELEIVYSRLPYSKKWHLHRFMKAFDITLDLLPRTLSPTRIPNPRYASAMPLPSIYTSASRLAAVALDKLSLPSIDAAIFEEVPELISDFLPLLLSGLEAEDAPHVTALLESRAPDERLLALRTVQRYYERTKQILCPEEAVIRACKQVGLEFIELGIACVEHLWNMDPVSLPNSMLEDLRIFYRLSPDSDMHNILLTAAKPETMRLSALDFQSPWQQLDFELVSFEASGDSTRLQHAFENTGIWALANKTLKLRDFYDYKQAWWLQLWDLPSTSTDGSRDPPMSKEDRIFGPLFDFFSGHSDESQAFSRLAQLNLRFPKIFGAMKARISSDTSPVVMQGRELLAVRSQDQKRLARELQIFTASLRSAGEFNEAAKYAIKLEKLSDDNNNSFISVISSVEASHTAWSLGDQSLAISMLQSMLANKPLMDQLDMTSNTGSVSGIDGDYTIAKIYSRLGTWARGARHEPDDIILKNYFLEAEQHVHEMDQEYVYHAFAHFCDAASHDSDLNEDLEDLGRTRMQRQRELSHLKDVVSESKEDKEAVSRKMHQVQRALTSETLDYSSLSNRKKHLTLKSVESYLKSLSAGDTYLEDMDKFIALWLEVIEEGEVNQLIYKMLSEGDMMMILSRKFLPWMNQLSSRLSKSGDYFQRALQLVITSCLQWHPHHTLWQLVNLYWSAAASDALSMERKSSAKMIMERVRAMPNKSRLLRDLSALAKQMVTLMKHPVDKKSKSMSLRKFGAETDRWWRRDLVKLSLPIPTSSIVPSLFGDYSSIPTITNVGSDVAIAGGLSSPKILTLVDSEGTTKHMVLKHGTDDLRQDAIMQQVFNIANRILHTSRGNRLRVRTYNVIPLGPAGGAIEFVEDTRSLQEVLEPLHRKLGGPSEYSLSEARGAMRDVQRGDRETRLATYSDVMEHTPPQMRRLWPAEKPDVSSWLAAKTNWCRSTAVMSIVGYVVGLGDRHCSNLLVDTASGEVVHIDLGIAFDQGRLLSVPETVPFRLTRDMVDGMGVCGVRGPYTVSATTTLSLVREHSSRILTVLEVLKHDALYSWRLPALRVKKAKASDADTKRPDSSGTTGQAEAALRGVRQKLQSSLSADATVRDLVSRARDPANLAVMFCGWSPFY